MAIKTSRLLQETGHPHHGWKCLGGQAVVVSAWESSTQRTLGPWAKSLGRPREGPDKAWASVAFLAEPFPPSAVAVWSGLGKQSWST